MRVDYVTLACPKRFFPAASRKNAVKAPQRKHCANSFQLSMLLQSNALPSIDDDKSR
jgi:hypothetical protein